MQEPRTKAGKPARLLAVLSVNFIGTLGFSLVIPFMVFLVTRLGGNAVVYGALGATYSAFQFLGAPVLGSWSDRYGRRRILLLSQGGTFLAWMIFLLALSLPATELADVDSTLTGAFTLTLPLLVLFVARALDGITGGNISVANAYLADISDEKNRSRNFGRMAISSNLGFILGPALAGILGSTAAGEVIPVAAAAAISLAAMVLIYFGLPESRPCVADLPFGTVRRALGAETKGCFDEATDRPSLKSALAIPGMPMMLALYFLIFLGFSIFYASFPMYASQELGWEVASLGAFFSVLSGMMILVQGPVLSRLSSRLADSALIVIGSLLLGVSFLLLMLATPTAAYGASVLFASGNGLMWPSFLSLLSRMAGEKLQGRVPGIGSSLGSLASIGGLLAGGILFSSHGPQTFLLAAVAIFTVALFGIRMRVLERRCSSRRTVSE